MKLGLGKRLISAGVVAIAALGLWVWIRSDTASIDPKNQIQVTQGRDLYARHCAGCHGANLEGEANWQTRKPSGELPAPPHDASGHTWHHVDEQLFALTKHGVARFAPPGYKTAMPAFVGILSDREILAILSFIQSTWPEDVMRRRAEMAQR